mmetsp:Transcript_16039/g.38269  ORF Transcript_16039/g.38269 Transcript_16039/m.38269 type:complete len:233 (+) Transcript_16039:530-1228(+)
MLVLLSALVRRQDGSRGAVAVRGSISVSNAHVERCIPLAVPHTSDHQVRPDPLPPLPIPLLQHHLLVDAPCPKGHPADVADHVPQLVVPLYHQPALRAVQGMGEGEGGTTPWAAGGEVGWAVAVANRQAVPKSIAAEVGLVAARRHGREPRVRLGLLRAPSSSLASWGKAGDTVVEALLGLCVRPPLPLVNGRVHLKAVDGRVEGLVWVGAMLNGGGEHVGALDGRLVVQRL